MLACFFMLAAGLLARPARIALAGHRLGLGSRRAASAAGRFCARGHAIVARHVPAGSGQGWRRCPCSGFLSYLRFCFLHFRYFCDGEQKQRRPSLGALRAGVHNHQLQAQLVSQCSDCCRPRPAIRLDAGLILHLSLCVNLAGRSIMFSTLRRTRCQRTPRPLCCRPLRAQASAKVSPRSVVKCLHGGLQLTARCWWSWQACKTATTRRRRPCTGCCNPLTFSRCLRW